MPCSVKVLERNLTVITVQVDSIISQGITVCGKGMIGPAGVVTCTFTGILPEEDRTGIDYFLSEFGYNLTARMRCSGA
jgi:hypothetical protein